MIPSVLPGAARILWALLVSLALGLAACDQDDGSGRGAAISHDDGSPSMPVAGGAPPGARHTIALVMKTLTNPFFIEMERGAREAEQDFGIELVVRTAAQETSIEQQIAIVDDLIRSGIDALVIAPGDSVRLIPVLTQAQRAGVVVVNIDNRLNPEFARQAGLRGVPFVSVDNEAGAYLSARVIADTVRQDGPIEAAILEGYRDADNAQARLRGAERAFAETSNITVVARETAHWKIDEAYNATRSLLAEHPGIDLIFAANDMMALGVIHYLDEASLTEAVHVAGFDALDEAMPALRDGTLAATIDQQADRQGYVGVEYAVRLLAGEAVPPLTLFDVQLLTSEMVTNSR